MKRVFSLLLCLVMAFGVITTTPAFEVQAASGEPSWYSGAYGNAVNPFAMSNLYGQCTWYAWGRAYELTKISLPCRGHGGTWADVARKNGYTVRAEPRENAIAVWSKGAYGHVAFVESVSGNNVTISESNWDRTTYDNQYSIGAGITYYSGRKTLTTSQMNSRFGTFLGYIYVGNSPGPTDTEPPKISDTYVEDWNVGSMGFIACVKFSDNVGINNDSVGFNIWSEDNGQDDMKWYRANVENGVAWQYIELPNHGNYLGNYIIHAYVSDTAGNQAAQGTSVNIQRTSLPSVSRQTIKDGTYMLTNGANYNMDVHGAGNGNGTRVENYPQNGSSAQKFRFEYKGNGNYLVYPECAPGKVIDVLRGTSWEDTLDQGDAIDIWEPGDYDAQLFKVIPVGNNQYVLELSTKKNYVIGGKHNFGGSQLHLQEYTNYSASCKWKFKYVSGAEGNPCNHSYTEKVTKAATCTATGTKSFTCACGDTYTESIPARGHRSSEWLTGAAAKPGVAGYKYTKCQTCGLELKRETIPALPIPLTSFDLNKTSLSLIVDEIYGLTVAAYQPSNTTSDRTAKWQSSRTDIVTVSGTGVLKAVAPGKATITCTVAGLSRSCEVTVSAPLISFTLNKSAVSVDVGKSCGLTVTTYVPANTTSSKTASWKSSNTKIVTVDSKGVVKGIAKGSATITCTVAGIDRTCAVTVTGNVPMTSYKLNKTSLTVNKGKTYTLKAVSYSPSDTTSSKTAIWKSSNTKIATVSSKGVVKGIAKGTATITCMVAGISKTCKVTVAVPMTSYKLSKTSLTVNKGKTYTLKAGSYSPSDTTGSKTASWKSSNTKIATVSSKGVVKGIAKGTATITCTVAGISKTCKVTVANVVTVSSPSSVKVVPGKTQNTISWKSASGASGYELYTASSSSGTYRLLKTLSSTIYKHTGLKTGTNYYYKVRAYRTVGGSKIYSGYCPTVSGKPTIPAPTGVKVFPYSYGISLVWETVPGVSGYQVYAASTKNGKYSLIDTLTWTSSFQNLSAGTTRYYKVRAYQGQGSSRLYGAYSSVVGGKAVLAKPSGAWLEASGNKNKLSWTTVHESNVGYEVYYSTSKSGSYKLLKSLTANTYSHTIASNKSYYYKIRTYRYQDGKKITSISSNVLSRETKKVTQSDLTGEWIADAGAFYDFNKISLSYMYGSMVKDSNRMIVGKDGTFSYSLGPKFGKGSCRVSKGQLVSNVKDPYAYGKTISQYFTIKTGDSTWLVEKDRDVYSNKTYYVYWRKVK